LKAYQAKKISARRKRLAKIAIQMSSLIALFRSMAVKGKPRNPNKRKRKEEQ
jgi:hypothetical protein